MQSRAARVSLFAGLFVMVVFFDQLTKWAARAYLASGASVTLVPGVIDLHLVFNKGAAFSLGEGWTWLFVAVAVVLCAGCAWAVATQGLSKAATCLLGVAAGGGVGNLIDRVTQGCVTDFFMPTFVSFPVFNFADICITCSFVALFILYWSHDARCREVETHE